MRGAGRFCIDHQASHIVQESPHALAAAGLDSAAFHALADAIDQAFCVIEVIFDGDRAIDYRFVTVNHVFEAQTGLHQAQGRNMRDLAPGHEAHWFEIYGEVALRGHPRRFVEQARALDRWFEVYAFRVGDGVRPLVGVLFRDITARREAEAALRKTETQAQLAVAIARLGTFRQDTETGLVYMDARMRELRGGGEAEVMPLAETLQRVHPDDRPRLLQAVETAIATADESGGGGFEVDYRILWPDGSEHWHAANGQVEFEGEGRRRHQANVLGTALDITVRKQAEAILREADARKDEFLATLAHELRNPLATIHNALQLQAAAATRMDAPRLQAMLDRQVEHMMRLIDELMEVSRITRGVIELKVEPLDFADVLRNAVEAARPAAIQAGHVLTLQPADTPLPVLGDAVRLAQILGNLLANAVRYTDPGGRIDVHAWRDAAGIHAAVADTGIGIPPGHLGRLFALFGQFDKNAPRSQGGLGIGLATTRKLAQMHGGDVQAASPGLGLGSTFTVSLPASDGPAAADDAKSRPGSLPNPVRVLVVDDNRDAADSVAMLLDMYGATATVAYDGASALEALAQWWPDVVLLDLGMPSMDGYEVATRIRQTWRDRPVMLVALTGWGQAADRDRTRAHGFDAHLVKPVGLEALLALLANCGGAASPPK
ncbi:PAS domain S-box-containing protein [Cupriavidus sp. OV038]|jgi:PAS domain S-box-containing protein|nr:PAS domain S-box-containing protein [Cupriavidus sp. OV038]SFP47440.1 PAS domain S-box-containing protein [Cupriavidus sp. OV096]